MTGASAQLPPEFSALERFADDWAIPDETDRYHKRHTCEYADLEEFYATINPRMPEISQYLDQFALDALTPEQERLLALGLMCMECFPAAELFKQVHVPQTYPWQQFEVNSPRRSTK